MNRAWGIILFMMFFSAGLIVVGSQEVFNAPDGQNPLGESGTGGNWEDVNEDDISSLAFFINPFAGDGIELLSVVSLALGAIAIIGTRVLRLPASATLFAIIFTANLVPISGFFEYLNALGISIAPELQMFVGVVIGMAMLGGLIDLAR